MKPETLLIYLIHLRVNNCIEIESRLKQNPAESIRGKLNYMKRRFSGKAFDAYFAKSAAPAELLVRQVVHWREMHDGLVAWLKRMAARRDLAPSDRFEDMVSQEYCLRAFAGLLRGTSVPTFAKLFKEKQVFPLFEKDFREVRTRTEIFWRTTPVEYLQRTLLRDARTSTLKIKENDMRFVLADFRLTIEALGNGSIAAPRNDLWTPEFDETIFTDWNRIVSFISGSARRSREDALRAQDASRQARRRKPPTYAEQLLEEEKKRTEKLRVDRLREDLERAGESFTPRAVAARNRRLRDLFKDPVKNRDQWWAEDVTVRPQASYLVAAALVHRVNWAMYLMKQEQQRIEFLEQELCQEMRMNPAPCVSSEEIQQPLPSATSGEYDPKKDDDGWSAFNARFSRVVMRSLQEANKREIRSEKEKQLRVQLEESLERLHQWKRYLWSHLPMARHVLDLDDPSDAAFYAASREPASGEVSLFHTVYPMPELGFGEELMQSIVQHVVPVELVYGDGFSSAATASAPEENTASATITSLKTDPRVDWHEMLKKIFPKACAGRDFALENDDTCRRNPAYRHYVLECFYGSLMGAYRHCRNPVSFDVAIMLERAFSLAKRWKPAQDVMLDVLISNEEVVINALRENLAWQFSHDSNLWMIDNNWVIGAMHMVRARLIAQKNLSGVQEMMLGLYGKNDFFPSGSFMNTAAPPANPLAMQPQQQQEPSENSSANSSAAVYRVNNNNFVFYLCEVFRSIEIRRVLAAVVRSGESNLRQKPMVCQLTPAAFQFVLFMVETKKPGSDIQTQWLREIGVSSNGVRKIEDAYASFSRRANEKEVERTLLSLTNRDYELCSLFFYILMRHYAYRHVPLDADLVAAQLRVRRKIYQVPETQAFIEPHLTRAFICNLMACNELKHYVVQVTQDPRYFGTVRLLHDAQRNDYFCASKKTVGMRARNKQSATSYIGSKPEFVIRARMNDADAFAITYTPFDELVAQQKKGGVDGEYGDEEGEDEDDGAAKRPKSKKQKPNADDWGDLEEEEDDDAEEEMEPKKTKRGRKKKATASVVTPAEENRLEELRRRIDNFRRLLISLQVGTEHYVHNEDIGVLLYDLPDHMTAHLSNEDKNKIKTAADDLSTEGKKESKNVFKLKYRRPCYELPAIQTPLVGYVLAKEKPKEKQKKKSTTLPITVCPQCGSVTHFSIANQYGTNGLTCGVCDALDRRMLHETRCFCCSKVAVTRRPPAATTNKSASSQANRDPVVVDQKIKWYWVRLLDDGPRGDGQYRLLPMCSMCYRGWIGVPQNSGSVYWSANSECRSLSRTELMRVLTDSHLYTRPSQFHDYAATQLPITSPEHVESLTRISMGLTVAEYTAMQDPSAGRYSQIRKRMQENNRRNHMPSNKRNSGNYSMATTMHDMQHQHQN